MAANPKALKAASPKAAGTAKKTAKGANKPVAFAAPVTKIVSVKPPAIALAGSKVTASTGGAPSEMATEQAKSVSPVLKMKDLIDTVSASTGVKKADVRSVVEATLAALGDALSRGDTLILPPLGRAKVTRAAELGSSKPMTIKLRRSTGAEGGRSQGKQSLADAED